MSGVVGDGGSSVLIRAGFALAEAGLLLAALHSGSRISDFEARADRTVGVITASSAGGSHPVIHVTTADGASFDFGANGLIFFYRPGDKVAVLYDWSAPRRSATLAAVGSLWSLPIMLSVLGLAFLIPLLSGLKVLRGRRPGSV